MPGFLKKIDPLLVGIIAATIIAFIAPARGRFADIFGVATTLAIALLFFLYGARLSTREAVRGLTHWRLHAVILAFTFVAYPLIGIALRPTTALISEELYQGIVFLTLVPSTVQSSVALTGIARGNVPGAVVSASMSSLIGVVVTPLLVMLLMGTGDGVTIDGSVFRNIALQLLLPFLLGQIAHNVVPRAGALAKSKATKIVDRGSIWMVVYAAFSQGVVAGVWGTITAGEIAFLILFAVVLVVVMLCDGEGSTCSWLFTARYRCSSDVRNPKIISNGFAHGFCHLRRRDPRCAHHSVDDLPPGAAADVFGLCISPRRRMTFRRLERVSRETFRPYSLQRSRHRW